MLMFNLKWNLNICFKDTGGKVCGGKYNCRTVLYSGTHEVNTWSEMFFYRPCFSPTYLFWDLESYFRQWTWRIMWLIAGSCQRPWQSFSGEKAPVGFSSLTENSTMNLCALIIKQISHTCSEKVKTTKETSGCQKQHLELWGLLIHHSARKQRCYFFPRLLTYIPPLLSCTIKRLIPLCPLQHLPRRRLCNVQWPGCSTANWRRCQIGCNSWNVEQNTSFLLKPELWSRGEQIDPP